MLTFLKGTSANTFQEEEGKEICCHSRKTCVCNWLATSHNKTRQLLLTKEEEMKTHRYLHASLKTEPIFPSKGRGRIIVVWSVKESTSHQRKHFSSKKTSPENPSPRHKTTFKCCQCGVYLCIEEGGSNCFYDYHTKEDFAN